MDVDGEWIRMGVIFFWGRVDFLGEREIRLVGLLRDMNGGMCDEE